MEETDQEPVPETVDENAPKKSTRRGRIFSITAWTLGVCYGVFEIVAHRDRMVGLHGGATILMILVGIGCIFSEVTALLRESK